MSPTTNAFGLVGEHFGVPVTLPVVYRACVLVPGGEGIPDQDDIGTGSVDDAGRWGVVGGDHAEFGVAFGGVHLGSSHLIAHVDLSFSPPRLGDIVRGFFSVLAQ